MNENTDKMKENMSVDYMRDLVLYDIKDFGKIFSFYFAFISAAPEV